MSEKTLTPAHIAERFRVSVDKVLGWIHSGQLVAINVATTLKGRPRFAVTPEALQAFENARATGHQAANVAPSRRQRKRLPAVKSFV